MLTRPSRMRMLLFILVAALLLPGGTGSAAGQQRAVGPPAAEEGVEKRLKEFLDVFNSGEAENIRKYAAENFAKSFLTDIPLEEHVKIISMGREQSGGFDLKRVIVRDPNTAEGLLQSRKGKDWAKIVLGVEAEPPHRIANIGIMPSGPVMAEAPKGPLTDAQMVEQLKKYLDEASKAEQFSGAVLLAKDGKPFFKAAYGLANRADNISNRVDTKFNLGSMNKMFTAVAIAQLAEKKKLAFSDPISKYLTDWLPAEVAQKVTIHHLLTHTSGLGSYFTESFFKSSRELYRKVDDYKPLLAEEKLQFEPGTKWSYSNTGFLLLGAIIEKVTGQSYFDYIRENIYKPAGMTNSDSFEMDDIVPNLAIGYTRREGKLKNNLYMHVIKGGPAGGGFSTVEDLLAFANALTSHKLLSPESTKLVTTAKPESKSPEYGYGFGINEDLKAVGHSGGFPGISSNLLIFLDSGYTLAVMSNVDAGAVDVSELVKSMLRARQKKQEPSDTFDQAVPPPK
jgi:CubicO group peptidase (beta-lactamase class C family)